MQSCLPSVVGAQIQIMSAGPGVRAQGSLMLRCYLWGGVCPRPCLIFWPLAHAARRRRGAPVKHLGGSLFPCPTQPACSPACQRVPGSALRGGMMHPARMQLPFPITGPPTAQFSPVQASAAQFAAVAAPSAAVAALPSPGAGADARPVLTHDSCHALARDVL